MLAQVDVNGTQRFSSRELPRCRMFLANRGLTCGLNGWAGNGMLGAIYFLGAGRGWEAACWRS